MTENARDGDQGKAERRAFLEKCGRFAVVTPPVISLMLAVSDKAAAQLATSPGRITTATIATTNTNVTTNTVTNTRSVTIVTSTPTTPLTELHAPSKHADLAMIVDSLGIRKVT